MARSRGRGRIFTSGEFCDTNVIVYAYDVTAGEKRQRAEALLGRLWDDGTGIISVQVLQELFVALTRKVPSRIDLAEARGIVAAMATWQTVEPTRLDVLGATDAAERWRISFWDAMILVAARRGGAEILWTEDLNEGQDYDGVVARNPFHDRL